MVTRPEPWAHTICILLWVCGCGVRVVCICLGVCMGACVCPNPGPLPHALTAFRAGSNLSYNFKQLNMVCICGDPGGAGKVTPPKHTAMACSP